MSGVLVGGNIEEIVKNDGVYASVTVGRSMRPLFKTHRDMVILEKCTELPEKYDVVLYRTGEKYILHRIIGIDNEKKIFIIRGDNTYKKEYIPFERIIARLVTFKRKGKHGSVTDRGYRIYTRVWNFIYPVRFVFHAFRTAAVRLYRLIFKKNNSTQCK